MILALFLTTRPVIGQPPANCVCYPPNRSPNPPHSEVQACSTPGCSRDPNPYCYIYPLNYGHNNNNNHFRGCNCPYYSYDFVSDNGAYYNSNGFPTFYNYTACADFGSNARDDHDNVPPHVHDAVGCCNFCCHHEHNLTTTGADTTEITTAGSIKLTTTTSTDAVTSGCEIILNKSLYFSGLTMLILVTLVINKFYH